LEIVDYFGGGFIIFIMATVQTIGICWIYGSISLNLSPGMSEINACCSLGLNRFVSDIEFMLNIKLGAYWKLTWAYIIPVTLLSIFTYSLASYSPLKEGDYYYPQAATGK
jgi:solute carrier family 6 (neurotransmitter transporter, glycine) member 5/9